MRPHTRHGGIGRDRPRAAAPPSRDHGGVGSIGHQRAFREDHTLAQRWRAVLRGIANYRDHSDGAGEVLRTSPKGKAHTSRQNPA
jgi:hypothetical protein